MFGIRIQPYIGMEMPSSGDGNRRFRGRRRAVLGSFLRNTKAWTLLEILKS